MLNFVKTLINLPAATAVLFGTIALTSTSSAQEALPGEGVSVRIAQPTDDTGWILSDIYGQLFEELGYDVQKPITLDIPVAYQAISQGSADIYPDGWFPLHNTYTELPGFDATLVGYVVERGALQGYLVDKESAEKYDIKTLDDFKRSEVREAFDRDGDGKADLVACPPGWGCELMIQFQLDEFDLRDSINPIKANYAASMADAIAALQQGSPILFYTWTPNWTVDALKPGEDVVWIQTPSVKLPEEQQHLADVATVEGVKGCVADPCRLGWPVNDIRPVVNNDFLEANPAVKTLLEAASIPVEFIFAQNAAMQNGENTPEDLERQAAEWIEANREQVDDWLEKARASVN
ncbi:glycine betaine/L-proline ABC transporter substrate-binding protein ProX [Aquamicrobium sp. LC103]|uniref:glycine betaine/L-proline ABC transporter substrate-binding protein ProX n=1 Tax=Aquamicrobium sp. LC103 TaxID=1120658 RepID=UPI00063E9D04|nr:glycine betaine/L-proline ABC transporter substrate-binding protein ProX [Aquamicrobium sp. LC103]TKT78207.1 glycine betaine/L-proline ABC transporter substrate-binding protein ProX [Aquamicrobium sp. LC103]